MENNRSEKSITREYVKTFPKFHSVKSVQIRSFPVFSPNTGKNGPEKTPYLDTFHAMFVLFYLMKMTIKSCRDFLRNFEKFPGKHSGRSSVF